MLKKFCNIGCWYQFFKPFGIICADIGKLLMILIVVLPITASKKFYSIDTWFIADSV
jgi:hypothetical protein